MGFAVNAATRGTCDRKQVGAVIILDKQVVATGYNGSVAGLPHCSAEGRHDYSEDKIQPGWWVCSKCGMATPIKPDGLISACKGAGHDMDSGHCVRTIHAEMNALAQAAKRGAKVDGSTIYTTASPCWDCFRVLANAGIKRFVFLEAYRADENANRIKAVVEALGLEVSQLPTPKKKST